MPLVGGGGSPNVAGSNPAGTGTSLNYVGQHPQHAYAYSGTVALPANSLTTMLKFSIGSSYVVATFQLEGDFLQIANDAVHYQILLNGEAILDTEYSPAHDSNYADTPTPILIPPYSDIEILGTHNQGGQNINFQAMIIGEVYA